jgi:hypothetical protein
MSKRSPRTQYGSAPVEAPDKQGAVEKAAHEFKTEIWRLYGWHGDEITRGDLKRKWPDHVIADLPMVTPRPEPSLASRPAGQRGSKSAP